ncbi:phosphoribose diphosphate:decaprenyl-phosphate phosphoribosyltransferase [Moorella thermoacetica]|uniref:Phosphoribose diphosphate:decaprenyl-phosphate phosphoribosyltransferase n=1 Tax=Neomoorella thermoacetica TaxID=1525 RepID=A0A1J5P5B6_NEOTH|nr:phosphoribose diphosphate:decaprenyl-phosphate phosphoribosyltransferase [Moorella thermoacetica]
MHLCKLKRLALYLLLPRPGAITGGAIYFWGGIAYGVALSHHFSVVDIAVTWLGTEFLVNQAKYWLNDYKDAASDRLHPRKSERAAAGGDLPVKWLPILAALRIITGIIFLLWYQPKMLPMALLLPAIQLWYDTVKRLPLVNAGVAASGSVVRFAAGLCAITGVWPLFFPCLLVYCQRLAIYVASYSAEGRYLLRYGKTPGKEYTLFYAQHPYLEKLAVALFLGLLVFAVGRSISGGIIITGIVVVFLGVLYYRINGPGDRVYWQGWKLLGATCAFVSKQLSEQFRLKYRQRFLSQRRLLSLREG